MITLSVPISMLVAWEKLIKYKRLIYSGDSNITYSPTLFLIFIMGSPYKNNKNTRL